MNNELENALTTLIEKVVTDIDNATTFLAAEIPDVIQQLLLWYTVKSALLFTFGAVMLFSLIWFVLKYCGKGQALPKKDDGFQWYEKTFTHDAYGNMNIESVILLTFIGAISMSVVIGIITSNMDWLKITIAPKIWLIEYAAGLVK